MQLDLDAEAALQPADGDLDVHLAHPGEELLTGLCVSPKLQSWILLVQTAERLRDLVLVALRLRRHGEAHHGLGEIELRHVDLALGVGEHVAGLHILQLRHGAEVTRAEAVGLVVVFALQHHQRAEALLGLVAQVDERRVAADRAAVDAERVDLAGERVGHGLEDERRRAAAVGDRRRLPCRRRHALDEQVEERVRAEVLRRDAARDGIELVVRDGGLQRRGHGLRIELLAAEITLHQLLVGLDDGVEQLLPVFGGLLGHRVRNRHGVPFPRAARIHVRAVVEQVDDAGELVLDADR